MLIWIFAMLLALAFGLFWLGYKTETYPIFYASALMFIVIAGSVYIDGITIKSGETINTISECIFQDSEVTPSALINEVVGYIPCDEDTNDQISGAIPITNNILFSAGYFDQACEFQSVNSADIEFTDLNYTSAGNEYTISMWIKTLTVIDNKMIMQAFGSDYSEELFRLSYMGDGMTDLINDYGISEWNFYPYNNNTWEHIFFIYNGTGWELYLNNTYIDFMAQTSPPGAFDGITLGSREGWQWFFDGYIDEVLIFNKSLDGTEREIVYTTQYPFMENSSSVSNATLWNFCPAMNETTIISNDYSITPIGTRFISGSLFLVMGLFSVFCGVIYATPKKDRKYN